jgi:carbon monoxide dehydrogenase subunit G
MNLDRLPTARHLAEHRGRADINRSADEVWLVVRNPASVADWHPAVDYAMMTGDKRILELVNGDVVVETVLAADDRVRHFEYSVIVGSVAGAAHEGNIDVTATGRHSCRVSYTVRLGSPNPLDLVAGSVQDAVDQLAAAACRATQARHGRARHESTSAGRLALKAV